MKDPNGGIWLLAEASALPPGWAARGTPVMLVRVPSADLPLLSMSAGGRHADLLTLAARGTPRADIARALGVSTRTVDRWIGDIRKQLGVQSAAEVAARLTESGW